MLHSARPKASADDCGRLRVTPARRGRVRVLDYKVVAR